jgi:hypothetical protein
MRGTPAWLQQIGAFAHQTRVDALLFLLGGEGGSTVANSQGPSPDMESEGTEPERQPDDLDIEVSDLHEPTLRPSGGQTRLASRATGGVPWHRHCVPVPRPVVAVVVVVLLALVLLVAAPIGSALGALVAHPTPAPTTAQFVFPTPMPATPTPSPYPTPTLASVPAVGPVPADCPPGSPLVDFSSGYTFPGIGGAEVWLVAGLFVAPQGVAVEPQATAHLGSFGLSDYTLFGWSVQVEVFVTLSLTNTITVTGRDLRTGYPLWLRPGVEAATPILTVDPSQIPNSSSDGQWRIWFGDLYLPGAGCYTLQASWLGGGWTVHFAAGR